MKFFQTSKKGMVYSKKSVKRREKEGEFGKKQIFLLILSGAVIGFLNGFFGGGGGMICVPILQKVLSLSSKESHATAIAVIFPLSYISSSIYVFNRTIESLPFLTIALGVVVGGILGAYVLKFMPPKALRIIFAFLMLYGGVRLIIWPFFYIFSLVLLRVFLEV